MLKTSRGFVRAEEVIGVRNPVYDEDNINFETARIYGLIPVDTLAGRRDSSIGNYERASRKLIQRGLVSIR